MAKRIYGYVRVSAKDQNESRQIEALAQFPVERKNIFMDKRSGKDFERPSWNQLLKKLQPGDLLVVKSIDRLGRNYEEILEQWRMITRKKQADISVIDFPLLDTRSQSDPQDLTRRFVADLVLQILAYVAQKERENIRRRQAEGIAAAKALGKRWGREKKVFPQDFPQLCEAWEDGRLSCDALLEHCNMKRSTFYKHLREYRDSISQKS